MAKLKINTGSTVTQATNKGTAVTIDAPCGQITMNNASLAAAAEIGFTVNNAYVGANDVVVVSIASGATAASYTAQVDAVAAGSFKITIGNYSAGALGEAIVLNYAIIKCSY